MELSAQQDNVLGESCSVPFPSIHVCLFLIAPNLTLSGSQQTADSRHRWPRCQLPIIEYSFLRAQSPSLRRLDPEFPDGSLHSLVMGYSRVFLNSLNGKEGNGFFQLLHRRVVMKL